MADKTTSDTATQTDNPSNTASQAASSNLPAAPGGNPDNRDTIQNMDTDQLRNAVVELLTFIDDSDDLDVVITVDDNGNITVAAA